MENDVRNTPQKLYVLGHPVAHSKSPVMYNAVYAKLGFPWEYGLIGEACARREHPRKEG